MPDKKTEKNFISTAYQVRAAVGTAVGAAAARAKMLADQEEREMELLMASIIETQVNCLPLSLLRSPPVVPDHPGKIIADTPGQAEHPHEIGRQGLCNCFNQNFFTSLRRTVPSLQNSFRELLLETLESAFRHATSRGWEPQISFLKIQALDL